MSATASRSDSDVPRGLSAKSWQSIRQQVRLGRYEAYAEPSGYASANPAHGFSIRYRNDGTTLVTPRDGEADSWRLELRLVGLGYEELHPVAAPDSLQADEQKLTYNRGNAITEWWVNDPSGLEQWFELKSPPAGRDKDERLRLALAVNGDFQGERQDDALVFRHGETKLSYADLVVWDANGKRLPSAMRFDGNDLMLAIDDSGAEYPVTIDPTIVNEEEELLPSDGAANDWFGEAVSISGNRALIGASRDSPNGPSSGSAYIFTFDGSSWIQSDKLVPSDGAATDGFGDRVAIHGDRALIGAPEDDDRGSAYVFEYDETASAWNRTDKLVANDGEFGDNFGRSVGLDGDRIIVGAKFDDDGGTEAGAAYIFDLNGGSWTQTAKLIAQDSAGDDRFGESVSIAGDHALIGARFNDDNGRWSGSAYIFEFHNSSWSQAEKLLPSDNSADDRFGNATSIDGDMAIIGARAANVSGNENQGAAYLFKRNPATGDWNELQKLTASDGAEFDLFGNSVAIDDGLVVIGATEATTTASDSGAAYVFESNGGSWSQLAKLVASDAAAEVNFGEAVAASGSDVLVGAPFADDNGTTSGTAYVFAFNSPPVARDDTVGGLEDSSISGDVLVDNGNGADSDPDMDALAVTTSPISGVANGNLTLNANGTFSYTPDTHFNGSDGFTYEVCDPSSACDTATVSITVDPVNDAPTFSATDPAPVNEDAGSQTLNGWASFDPGPANESGQSVLAYTVTNVSDPSLFAAGPAVDTNGTLTYTTAEHANGTSSFDVTVQDDGGTPNDGDDTSTPQTFTITVNPVNDAPTFTAGGDVQTFEDTAVDQPWASNISPGPPDESGQSVSFMVTDNTNPGLFSTGPAVDSNGQLTFTPTPDTTGSADISLEAEDDGGTANSGDPISDPATFTVDVIAAADLAIDKTSGAVFVEPGGMLTYTIDVTNAGPSDVVDARVQDDPPARLGNLSWTCTPQGMASCNAGDTGAIDELVTIPEGDSVIFTLDATLQDMDTTPVTNTASVTAPTGLTEIDSGNNADSDTDQVGMFVDGFELEEPD